MCLEKWNFYKALHIIFFGTLFSLGPKQAIHVQGIFLKDSKTVGLVARLIHLAMENPAFQSGSEIWTLYNDPDNMPGTMEALALELFRCSLFTVPIDYLYDSLKRSRPIITVRQGHDGCHENSAPPGTLLGISILNVQSMNLSDEAILNLKSGGGPRTEKTVVHMSMFSISTFSENDLGNRLMQTTKAVAASLESELFIIEALNVLTEYYSNHGFEFASRIVKVGGSGLTGMALKSSDFCKSMDIFSPLVEPVVPQKQPAKYTACPTGPEFAEAVFLQASVGSFLANKDTLSAAKKLRDLALRSNLNEREYLKLWKFRSKRLKQQKCEDLYTIVQKF